MTKKADEAKADYLAGLSYKEIAERYNVSVGTVRAWKSRYKWDGEDKSKDGATNATQHATKSATQRNIVAMQEVLDSAELTEKQKLFCAYYLQRFNATWAYQKAYDATYTTAASEGPRTLANPRVKTAIAELKAKQQESIMMDANDILLQYIKQATASLGDVINYDSYDAVVEDKDGNPLFDEDNKLIRKHSADIYLKPSDQVDWSLIEDIHVGRDGLVVKLYDKQKAMKELLDRLPEPVDTNQDDDAFLKAIYEAKRGTDDEDQTI